ncbi:MAG: 2-oxo acid dehydrogenase subunit E2 [Leptolyngbya sp. SIOISBB]|nr:2-oxo acid dehydrogenase subunit E2 [Leptolyngbya sp. SIOISBB]
MKKSRGYRVAPFGRHRQLVAASVAVNRETNTIQLLTEVDISRPRHLIAEYRDRTGERLSLTAYVVACLARALDDFPQFNAFHQGRRLILFDDLTISILFERDLKGELVPEVVGLPAVNRKTYRQIHDELRAIQQRPSQPLDSATGIAWMRFIPGCLLRTLIRLAARNINLRQRFGVVAVTAVGMFGSGPMWLLPLTGATVTVAVGAIAKRPVLIEGCWQEREHLCLTLTFDHDIIDGAPAARFTSQFAAHLASGDELDNVVDTAAYT